MKNYEDFFNEAQQYVEILKRYEENGEIFTDPNFLPTANIQESKIELNDEKYIWHRIDEYYTAPLFKKEAIKEEAIQQGELENSYFIASLTRIAKQPDLVEILFDTRTKLNENTINLKCGAVIVYFYIFGKKTPILIDTLIPFQKETQKPRFSRPSDSSFSPWFCLVEKAYAKLNGSYSSIADGRLSQAISQLFNYYPEYKKIDSILQKRKTNEFDAENSEENQSIDNEFLFSLLMKYQYENAVIGADISTKEGLTQEDIKSKGLVESKTYLILKARKEEDKNLICLRSPLSDKEWNGDWSNASNLWTTEMKRKLGFHRKSGTFWMNDSDFFNYFSSFDIAKPINPEHHSKSFIAKLEPDENDGFDVNSPSIHLENRQTFAFKPNDEDNETTNDVKVHITVEKRSPVSDSDSQVQILLVYSNDKKVESDKLSSYNCQTIQTRNNFFKVTIHFKEKKPFVIIVQRTDKKDFAEEVFVSFTCKNNFDLYDVDFPDQLFEENDKAGVLFNNESKRYKNIARKIVMKNINGKEIRCYETDDSDSTFCDKLDLNPSNETSSGYFEYDISDDGEMANDNLNEINQKESSKEMSRIQKDILNLIDKEISAFSQFTSDINTQQLDMNQFNDSFEKINQISSDSNLILEEKIQPFFKTVRSLVLSCMTQKVSQQLEYLEECNRMNSNSSGNQSRNSSKSSNDQKYDEFIQKLFNELNIDQNEADFEAVLNSVSQLKNENEELQRRCDELEQVVQKQSQLSSQSNDLQKNGSEVDTKEMQMNDTEPISIVERSIALNVNENSENTEQNPAQSSKQENDDLKPWVLPPEKIEDQEVENENKEQNKEQNVEQKEEEEHVEVNEIKQENLDQQEIENETKEETLETSNQEEEQPNSDKQEENKDRDIELSNTNYQEEEQQQQEEEVINQPVENQEEEQENKQQDEEIISQPVENKEYDVQENENQEEEQENKQQEEEIISQPVENQEEEQENKQQDEEVVSQPVESQEDDVQEEENQEEEQESKQPSISDQAKEIESGKEKEEPVIEQPSSQSKDTDDTVEKEIQQTEDREQFVSEEKQEEGVANGDEMLWTLSPEAAEELLNKREEEGEEIEVEFAYSNNDVNQTPTLASNIDSVDEQNSLTPNATTEKSVKPNKEEIIDQKQNEEEQVENVKNQNEPDKEETAKEQIPENPKEKVKDETTPNEKEEIIQKQDKIENNINKNEINNKQEKTESKPSNQNIVNKQEKQVNNRPIERLQLKPENQNQIKRQEKTNQNRNDQDDIIRFEPFGKRNKNSKEDLESQPSNKEDEEPKYPPKKKSEWSFEADDHPMSLRPVFFSSSRQRRKKSGSQTSQGDEAISQHHSASNSSFNTNTSIINASFSNSSIPHEKLSDGSPKSSLYLSVIETSDGLQIQRPNQKANQSQSQSPIQDQNQKQNQNQIQNQSQNQVQNQNLNQNQIQNQNQNQNQVQNQNQIQVQNQNHIQNQIPIQTQSETSNVPPVAKNVQIQQAENSEDDKESPVIWKVTPSNNPNQPFILSKEVRKPHQQQQQQQNQDQSNQMMSQNPALSSSLLLDSQMSKNQSQAQNQVQSRFSSSPKTELSSSLLFDSPQQKVSSIQKQQQRSPQTPHERKIGLSPIRPSSDAEQGIKLSRRLLNSPERPEQQQPQPVQQPPAQPIPVKKNVQQQKCPAVISPTTIKESNSSVRDKQSATNLQQKAVKTENQPKEDAKVEQKTEKKPKATKEVKTKVAVKPKTTKENKEKEKNVAKKNDAKEQDKKKEDKPKPKPKSKPKSKAKRNENEKENQRKEVVKDKPQVTQNNRNDNKINSNQNVPNQSNKNVVNDVTKTTDTSPLSINTSPIKKPATTANNNNDNYQFKSRNNNNDNYQFKSRNNNNDNYQLVTNQRNDNDNFYYQHKTTKKKPSNPYYYNDEYENNNMFRNKRGKHKRVSVDIDESSDDEIISYEPKSKKYRNKNQNHHQNRNVQFDDYDSDLDILNNSSDDGGDNKLAYENEYFNFRIGGNNSRYANPAPRMNNNFNRGGNQRPRKATFMKAFHLQNVPLNCSYLPARLKKYQ